MNRAWMWILIGLFVCGCESPKRVGTVAPEKSKGAESQISKTEAAYLKDGIQHLQEADVVDAIKSFDQAIKQDPLEPQAYLVLSQTYTRIKQYDRAINILEAAQRVAPNRGDIQYMLAVNYSMTGQNDLAKKSVQRSIELFRQAQDEENFTKAIALLQGMLKTEEQRQ